MRARLWANDPSLLSIHHVSVPQPLTISTYIGPLARRTVRLRLELSVERQYLQLKPFDTLTGELGMTTPLHELSL
jgi:hypothetical protein